MAAEARAGGVPDPADRPGEKADGAESTRDSAPEERPEKVHGDPLAADAAESATTTNGPKHSAPKHSAPAEAEEGAPVGEPAKPFAAEVASLRTALEERTRDLQRVTAEYANYRKRVDRDRSVAAEQTTGSVLIALLPVLDDIDRAREHGDLVGPFASVAEALGATVGKLGLVAFGEKGDAFDPTRHEAVAHLTSADVTEPTCVEVMRRGYTLGERLLRPALVAVADPE